MTSGVYKRTEEHKVILRKNSAFKKGHKISLGKKYHLGFKHSVKTKEKISSIQKKQFSSGDRKVWCEGLKLTKEHRKKMSESHQGQFSGEKHWNWQGGKTSIKRRIWALREYQKWRSEVFKRDNYHCQHCGTKSEKGIKVFLEAHHVIPFAKILQEFNIKTIEEALNCKLLWDSGNGITYCRECHLLLDENIGRPVKCAHF